MEQKQINLLIAGVIVVLIFGVFQYLISPKYQEMIFKNSEIESLQGQIKNINDYYSFTEASFQKLKNAGWETKKDIIGANFTSSPFFFPKAHHLLRNLASQNGLTVSNITNSNPVDILKTQEEYKDLLQGPVKKTTFNLSLLGTQESFKNLLSTIENQARIITVKNISVLPVSTYAGPIPEGFLNFNLSVDLYSY
ncbi:MAG: hypothetical protein WC446_00695 [Candidatus Paceibacterota bacterium]|jgi:hypothetical protein